MDFVDEVAKSGLKNDPFFNILRSIYANRQFALSLGKKLCGKTDRFHFAGGHTALFLGEKHLFAAFNGKHGVICHATHTEEQGYLFRGAVNALRNGVTHLACRLDGEGGVLGGGVALPRKYQLSS